MRGCKLPRALHPSRRQSQSEGTSKTAPAGSLVNEASKAKRKGPKYIPYIPLCYRKTIQYFCKQWFYRREHRSRSKSLGILLYYVMLYCTVHFWILFEKQIRQGELKPVVPRHKHCNFRKTPTLSNAPWETLARVEVNSL